MSADARIISYVDGTSPKESSFYKWHDLKEDPEDLPVCLHRVLVMVKDHFRPFLAYLDNNCISVSDLGEKIYRRGWVFVAPVVHEGSTILLGDLETRRDWLGFHADLTYAEVESSDLNDQIVIAWMGIKSFWEQEEKR